MRFLRKLDASVKIYAVNSDKQDFDVMSFTTYDQEEVGDHKILNVWTVS